MNRRDSDFMARLFERAYNKFPGKNACPKVISNKCQFPDDCKDENCCVLTKGGPKRHHKE